MANLRNFCRSLDRQVADLERETRTAVISSRRGPYASNAADQLREEAVALSRDIENSLGTVVEERNNMASFLDEMKVQFGEIVAKQLKMEDFMGQYGFKPKTPVNIDELLNWEAPPPSVTPAAAAEFDEELIEDVEEPDLSPGETDTIKPVKEMKTSAKTPSVKLKSPSTSDSPNFFEVGLSSLAMEMYVGKSTKSKKAPQEETQQAGTVPQISTFTSQANADDAHLLNPQSRTAASFICNDSLYAASPVLRLSSKLTKQPDLSNVSNTDTVDITPGLPSRKKANTQVLPVNDTTTATPNLSVLHWQQSSTASPDLPSVRQQPVRSGQFTPQLSRLPPANSDTPELPDLQTVDIRKLMSGSSHPAPAKTATDTPEEPQLTCQYVRQEHLVTKNRDTPEEPQLTCQYVKQDHFVSKNTDTPEEPQLTTQYSYPTTSTRTGRTTPDLPIIQKDVLKSPETPVLSYHSWK